MNWSELLGNLLGKAGESVPAPSQQAFTDPFNFLLDRTLRQSYPDLAVLQAEVQQAFPTLTAAGYEAAMQQLAAAQNQAITLASAVNKHQLTEDEARERLAQAIPQLSAANASRLLMQNLIGTR